MCVPWCSFHSNIFFHLLYMKESKFSSILKPIMFVCKYCTKKLGAYIESWKEGRILVKIIEKEERKKKRIAWKRLFFCGPSSYLETFFCLLCFLSFAWKQVNERVRWSAFHPWSSSTGRAVGEQKTSNISWVAQKNTLLSFYVDIFFLPIANLGNLMVNQSPLFKKQRKSHQKKRNNFKSNLMMVWCVWKKMVPVWDQMTSKVPYVGLYDITH